MTDRGPDSTALTAAELELVKKIAQRDGITEDEAATNLFKTALARHTRKRTGKGPAKVYTMKRK